MLQLQVFNESTPTELLLLVVAFVLSAIVGLERQRRLKSTGMRTHTLVGLGTAAFTLVSAYGFQSVLGTEVNLDPARIAAQIVSGIGFLGAGVIFVRQNAVNGLTTAASIWVTASIGMACGAGMVTLAVATTLLYLAATGILTVIGRKIPSAVKDEVFLIQYKDGRGALRDVLATATGLGYHASLLKTRKIEIPGKTLRIEASMIFRRSQRGPLEELIEQLSEVRGVISVRLRTTHND